MTTATPLSQNEAVHTEALAGLTSSPQKTLPPWLFYDQRGSELFEQITALPEYYLTRTERNIFSLRADDIFLEFVSPVTIAELGAGTASKTGLLLHAATRFQPVVLYQPIDVSSTALDEASETLTSTIPGLLVQPQVANYITEQYTIARPEGCRILALYIGSSIGNFSPSEAAAILQRLRSHLEPGDALLLGTDLCPNSHKTVVDLLAAYDDKAGVTAAFNKNILAHLNYELDGDFDLDNFAHRALWNEEESRIEMHLESLTNQTVKLAGQRIQFKAGETIHTESSYKFTHLALESLLASSDFTPSRTYHDPSRTYAVTLARAL